jgi:hypothetical protein
MPITIYSLDEIQTQVDVYFRTRFPGRDLGSESFLGKTARAISMALLLIQKAVSDADKDASPTEQSSAEALETFAYIFGLSSNLGGYGRNGAVAASGGVGTVSGIKGTTFDDDSLLYASDGVTKIRLSGAVTIPGTPPGSDQTDGLFVAETTGIAGNLIAGSILTWASPPAGGDSTVTLTSELAGGSDVETDAELLERLYLRLQQPPKGGAASDYRFWAEEGSAAVHRAYCYPNREGTGTVDVIITADGSGQGRSPSNSVKTAVQTYVDGVRPVTVQECNVLQPAMPDGVGVTIRARLLPAQTKYNFDWDDTTATYATSSWVAGPPASFVITPTPAGLEYVQPLLDQVDLGLRPRLQIEITGGPVVPIPVRVESYVVGVGPVVTLYLENPLPTGFLGGATAVTDSDKVTAGGPIAEQTANALLDYVDSLGPSRQNGFDDLPDQWEDIIAIARLTEIALDQVDPADGARYTSNVAVSGGITVDAATDDVEARADVSGAPEILYAARVVVTQ